MHKLYKCQDKIIEGRRKKFKKVIPGGGWNSFIAPVPLKGAMGEMLCNAAPCNICQALVRYFLCIPS